MSVTRRTWTDDDGSGTTGTIHDNAELQRVYDDIDARWMALDYFATGTQNAVSLVYLNNEADVLVLKNTSDVGINGIVAPTAPAKPGKPLWLISRGSANVYLGHNSGSASAANRLSNLATSGNSLLAAGVGRACYRYDTVSSLWVMVYHDQGGFVPATFAAGNFTGNGSMAWTVASGDRGAAGTGYWQRGNRVHYTFQIAASTVGGTPNTQLRINKAEWGGFTAFSIVPYRRLAVSLDNGTDVGAYCTVVTDTLQISKSGGTNWTSSTDNTYVYGDIEFHVT